MKAVVLLISVLMGFSAFAVRPGVGGVGELYESGCAKLSEDGLLVYGASICLATVSGDFSHRYLVLKRKFRRSNLEVYQVKETAKVGNLIRIEIRRFNPVLMEADTQVAGRGTFEMSGGTVKSLELRMQTPANLLGDRRTVKAIHFQ